MPVETLERAKPKVGTTLSQDSEFKTITPLRPAELLKDDLKEIELIKESNITNKCQGECNAGCRGGGGKHCSIVGNLRGEERK